MWMFVFFHLHSSLQTQTLPVAFQCFLNQVFPKHAARASTEVAFKKQQNENILFSDCYCQNKIPIDYLEGQKTSRSFRFFHRLSVKVKRTVSGCSTDFVGTQCRISPTGTGSLTAMATKTHTGNILHSYMCALFSFPTAGCSAYSTKQYIPSFGACCVLCFVF